MSFRIHFHDVPHSDRLRDACEEQANALREEFPETSKVEVSISRERDQHDAHVHVTGKRLDVASRAQALAQREAVQAAFDRVRRQLRTHHDKQIGHLRKH